MESEHGKKYFTPNYLQVQSAVRGYDRDRPRHSPLWAGVLALMVVLMSIFGLIFFIHFK